MKKIALLCSLILTIHANAQHPAKKYTFKDVGWTITLPGDFQAFPSADSSVQVPVIGQNPTNISVSKRLMTAFKMNNNFSVGISTVLQTDQSLEDIVRLYNNRTYESFAKTTSSTPDSLTTIEMIDGMKFEKFRILIKERDNSVSTFVYLINIRKGVYLNINYWCFNDKTVEEIETMLKNSKFTR